MSDCIIWTGAKLTSGYGSVRHDGRSQLAHRVAYMQARGSIPDGMQIDHLCRVRLCVNPEHLEAVTQQENIATCLPSMHGGLPASPQGAEAGACGVTALLIASVALLVVGVGLAAASWEWFRRHGNEVAA